MRLNKKGISPLIATVLIIGFTVALAAIIMTWGQSFTKNIQEQTEETANTQLTCTRDVEFKVDKVCLEGGTTYKIYISNLKEKKIEKLQLRFYQSDELVKVIKDQFATGIDSFGFETKSVDATITDVKKVDAIATIRVEGIDITCPAYIASKGSVDDPAFGACSP
ncbi:MAG: hypothetical protein PHE43_03420 [Candidatus Nanoarchaeia archaeon]|nr:hypothetical protein [Candidatus Nanoarchaeia archaeon]